MVIGVYPLYNTGFKIGLNGKLSTDSDMVTIADMTSFEVAIDGNVENWTPMTTNGWARALITGKSGKITLKGKRNIGDPGNDYIHSTTYKDGLDCSTKGEIDFPDGSKLNYDCVINVTSDGGGDSTNVAPLEFEMQIDGKPTYTPASTATVFALSSSVPANEATGVSGSTVITLTFSDTVNNYSGIVILGNSGIVDNTMSWDEGRKVLTITPNSTLQTGDYTVVLSGVTSAYGSRLNQSLIKFTVV